MRGTFDPGYLNYTLGKLQILKLRDDYKAQEGDKFSLAKIPQRAAQPRHAADSSAARNHAQGQEQVGRRAVICFFNPALSLTLQVTVKVRINVVISFRRPIRLTNL